MIFSKSFSYFVFASVLSFTALDALGSTSLKSFRSTTEIIDPNHLLTKVDEFLKGSTFDTALVCGTKVNFSHPVKKFEFKCDESGCLTSYEMNEGAVSQKTVGDCSADSAMIYSNRGDIDEVTRADFDAHSGNMARRVLENVGDILFYNLKVRIDRIETATFKINRGLSNEKEIPSMNIYSSLLVGDAYKPPVLILSVIQGAPAVAQLVRFRLDGTTWYYLKDY